MLAATDSGFMKLSNVTFKSNTAGVVGGAVASYVTASQGTAAVSVMGCLFKGNHATGAGTRAAACMSTTPPPGPAPPRSSSPTTPSTRTTPSTAAASPWTTRPATGRRTPSRHQPDRVRKSGINRRRRPVDQRGDGRAGQTAAYEQLIAGNYVENPPTFGPDVSGNALSLGFNLIGETTAATPSGSPTTSWEPAQPAKPRPGPDRPDRQRRPDVHHQTGDRQQGLRERQPRLGNGPADRTRRTSTAATSGRAW